jgi:hypothetical protein
MFNQGLLLLPNHSVHYKQEGHYTLLPYGPQRDEFVPGKDRLPMIKEMHMHKDLQRSETYGDPDPRRLDMPQHQLNYCKNYGFCASELQPSVNLMTTASGANIQQPADSGYRLTETTLWEWTAATSSAPGGQSHRNTLTHQKLLAFAMADHSRLGGLDSRCIYHKLPSELMEMILLEGCIFTTLQMLEFCRRYYNDVGQERTLWATGAHTTAAAQAAP